MIGGRQPLRGRRPGDMRVRVERPHTPYFRYTGPGTLVAKPAAIAPKTRAGQAILPCRGGPGQTTWPRAYVVANSHRCVH